MIVVVILAAGKSTRFGGEIPKQLYPIEGKPVIQWSIDLFEKFVDHIVIVTNSNCKIETNHTLLINDIDDRLISIKTALDSIQGQFDKIIIHDAARPFITDDYIKRLIESKSVHSQYYLPLTNGLAKKSDGGWEIVDRKDFIELCSPQCTDFDLFKTIFETYIQSGIECEVLPCLKVFNFEADLIEGNSKYLRKINTILDI